MKKDNKKKGFTLAEVLITLTILGTLAAILFPSILANYNERTYGAKRTALVSRMSQAMAELTDQFKNYENVSCTDPAIPTTCTDNGSALKFISEGLSSVYKIAATCDSNSLAACDIPTAITRADGTILNISNGIDFISYNKAIKEKDDSAMPYNTSAAALMTKNGESILLFYNPNCSNKPAHGDSTFYADNKICVNMVYDLNGGKKKPNRVGEDIGFISSFYSDKPYVAAPRMYDSKGVPDYTVSRPTTIDILTKQTYTLNEAQEACAALGGNVSLPSIEQAMAIQINLPLLTNGEDENEGNEYIWTGSVHQASKEWDGTTRRFVYSSYMPLGTAASTGLANKYGYVSVKNTSTKYKVRCVYSD